MNSICTCNLYSPPLNKSVMGAISLLAITGIALAIIGLAASSSGPFNALVSLGPVGNGSLLGVSIFALAIDLVWLKKVVSIQLELKSFSRELDQWDSSGNVKEARRRI